MRLIILRHAEAVPGSDQDAARVLTVRGQEQARLQAQRLVAEEGSVSLLTSPWRRARQTADHIAVAQGIEPVESECLTPGGSAEAVVTLLESHAGVDTLIVVTHQPLCGRLINWLVDASRSSLSVAPASGAELELDWPAAGLAYHRRWLSPTS